MTATSLVPVKMSQLSELLKLMAEYYAYDGLKLDPRKARAALKGLLANPRHGQAWFIQSGGQCLGYSIVCFAYSIEFGGRYAFIDEIYLHKDFRSLGHGRKVMQLLEIYSRRCGVKVQRLEVEQSNRKARNFYEKLGFVAHKRTLMTRWL